MDYQTIVFLLEGYLASEGNTTEGALRYIRELENQMAREMERHHDEEAYPITQDDIDQMNEWESLEEEENIHYYSQQPEKETRNFWIPLAYGDHEYALVNRNEDGSLNYKGYHTT